MIQLAEDLLERYLNGRSSGIIVKLLIGTTIKMGLFRLLQIDFVAKGSVQIETPNKSYSVVINELIPATTYNVYAIGQDDSVPPNLMKAPRSVTTRTLDNLPPIFVESKIVDVKGASGTILVQMDEPSLIFYAVYGASKQHCPAAEKVCSWYFDGMHFSSHLSMWCDRVIFEVEPRELY